jgi:raffinose/stachyose/melibiose transport system permease protein
VETVLRSRRAVLVFVGPALLFYLLILLIPILWAMGYTVFEGSPITGFKFNGLGNYARLLEDQSFWDALWFGLRYAVIVSAGQVFFGLLLSILYVFYLKHASTIIRTLVFFPVVLPTVAVAQMFVKMFAIAPQYGLVNAGLDALGLGTWVQAWLGQPGTAFGVIVLMDIWRAMGFYAILLYAGLVEIPTEVFEAATLDGARGWQLIWSVVIPLLRPVLVSAIVFSLNGTLKVFDTVIALTNGGPGGATTPLTLYMYKTAFTYGQYGYGSTVALVLTAECLVVSLLVLRIARREVA